MEGSRANVVSSFTIVKGSLIEETYSAFQEWDFAASKRGNLERLMENGVTSTGSRSWRRNVAKVLNRRFEPATRDRALVELAKAGCSREIWKPILLWHMTRDEFLVRDFLTGWLYERYREGTYRIRTEDVVPYLKNLAKRRSLTIADRWSETTTSRVASALLRIAADFGLMTGKLIREFAAFHLPEESFLYLLHALAESEPNATRILESGDWHMYLMDAADVERELLRLHQFRRVHYQVAGSLTQLTLPCPSAAAYSQELAR